MWTLFLPRRFTRDTFYDTATLSSEIQQSVDANFESSRKLFCIVQKLAAIATELDPQDQDKLLDLANELMEAGKEVSDNAEKICTYFFNALSSK